MPLPGSVTGPRDDRGPTPRGQVGGRAEVRRLAVHRITHDAARAVTRGMEGGSGGLGVGGGDILGWRGWERSTDRSGPPDRSTNDGCGPSGLRRPEPLFVLALDHSEEGGGRGGEGSAIGAGTSGEVGGGVAEEGLLVGAVAAERAAVHARPPPGAAWRTRRGGNRHVGDDEEEQEEEEKEGTRRRSSRIKRRNR